MLANLKDSYFKNWAYKEADVAKSKGQLIQKLSI